MAIRQKTKGQVDVGNFFYLKWFEKFVHPYTPNDTEEALVLYDNAFYERWKVYEEKFLHHSDVILNKVIQNGSIGVLWRNLPDMFLLFLWWEPWVTMSTNKCPQNK